MVSQQRVVTFVMAGGRGQRLFPLTRDRAKPAVPFGGIYRIIDFTLSNCVNSGFRKIHVLTQYKSISLARHLRLGWNMFNPELGEYLDFIPAQQRVDEHWYQGTADSIYQNIYTIDQEDADHVLILAGDHVYKMDYAKLLEEHAARDADVTVGMVKQPIDRCRELGVAETDDRLWIRAFHEKAATPPSVPGDPTQGFASMGIYIFKTDVLEDVLRADAAQNTEHDFGRNIIPSMTESGARVLAYPFVDENREDGQYWRDIGTIDAYHEANMDLVKVSPTFNLYDEHWPIFTYHEQAPPAKTVFAQEQPEERMGVALDSVISNGCIISGGRIQRTVCSPHVRVNSFAQADDSVLLEHVVLGRHCKIKRTIIDKDVTIPEGIEIGYDLDQDRKRFTVTPSGIVVVPKGTHIPDRNTQISLSV